jgi:uncharacterized protein YycO
MEDRRQQVRLLRRAGCAAVGIVCFLLSTPVSESRGVTAPRRSPLSAAELRDGDLVFRRGRDALSRIALSYSEQAHFSHVGMVIRSADAVRVVHALPADGHSPGGVRSEPLERFIATPVAEDVAYFRLDMLTSPQRARIHRYLHRAIGAPFDYRFRYSDDTALYCSELVVKALKAAGIDLERGLQKVSTVTLVEPAIPPDAIVRSALVTRFH